MPMDMLPTRVDILKHYLCLNPNDKNPVERLYETEIWCKKKIQIISKQIFIARLKQELLQYKKPKKYLRKLKLIRKDHGIK